MNNNTLIGGLVVVLVLGVGYFIYKGTTAPPTSPIATSTPPVTTTPPTPNTPVSASAPLVQTDQKVTASNATAVVTGRVTPNGAPTSYWYEYGVGEGLGNRTSPQAIGSGFRSIPSPGYITGLAPNTSYYFRLVAQNTHGTTNGTVYSFSTNNNPPPSSLPPSINTDAATEVMRTSGILNAHVNPRGSQTTFWFEYGTTTSFGSVTAFQPGGADTTSQDVSTSLTGLAPLTKYYFRINAQNQYGTVNGTTLNFTTDGPAAASIPSLDTTSASAIATSSATLSGRVSPNNAETTYWFEYGEDNILGHVLGTVTTSQKIGSSTPTLAVSAKASGLSPNTQYYYRIAASNSAGTARGDIVSFKTTTQ